IEIGGCAVRDYVGGRSAFGYNALNAGLGPKRAANAVDIFEEVNDGFQRVPSVPGRKLVRGRSTEGVFDSIDVHATCAESRSGPRGRGAGVAADYYVHAVEDAGVKHDGLGVGRHHLFTRTAEDDDAARRFRASQIFGNGNGGRYADGALGA